MNDSCLITQAILRNKGDFSKTLNDLQSMNILIGEEALSKRIRLYLDKGSITD